MVLCSGAGYYPKFTKETLLLSPWRSLQSAIKFSHKVECLEFTSASHFISQFREMFLNFHHSMDAEIIEHCSSCCPGPLWLSAGVRMLRTASLSHITKLYMMSSSVDVMNIRAVDWFEIRSLCAFSAVLAAFWFPYVAIIQYPSRLPRICEPKGATRFSLRTRLAFLTDCQKLSLKHIRR